MQFRRAVFLIYDFGFTILDLRFWIYDFGFTILDFGFTINLIRKGMNRAFFESN